ncbi:MAG: methionyl-tRNA formyltransferase [Campylobacter sp.]|nr:methionyl-tRNA formyltransferase [Campylobacter sp.]
MNIIFMGTPKYAVDILSEILANGIKVSAVFTQPDKKVGRKQILTPCEVKKFAIQKRLEVLQPITLKDKQIYSFIKGLKPDFIVVGAYGQILPKEILDITPCINLHASILPEFRGASPIQSAILRDDKFGGVTAMKMGVGLDDGDMLGFSFDSIDGLNSNEVFDKFGKMAAKLALKTLKNYSLISPISQTHALSSKCQKIKKQDGLISLNENIDEILAKFRAFYPWPGVFLQSRLKLLEIKKFKSNSGDLNSTKIGEISQILKNSFVIKVLDGEIEIISIQEPGKKALKGSDFINGKRLKIGDKIA